MSFLRVLGRHPNATRPAGHYEGKVIWPEWLSTPDKWGLYRVNDPFGENPPTEFSEERIWFSFTYANIDLGSHPMPARVFPKNTYLEASQTALPMAVIVHPFARRGSLLLVIFIVFALPLRLPGQEPEGAPEFMHCLKEAYPDAGQALDSLMARFESELIGEGLLESPEPEDYRGLLQRLASGQRIEWTDYQGFSDRFRDLTPDSTALRACNAWLERFKATHPEAVLTRFLDRREAMVREGIPADLQAAALLDILRETHLDQPFYRLYTYYLVDLQALSPEGAGLDALTPFSGYSVIPQPGANIMRVYLNERNQFILSDQVVTPENLTGQVLQHARQFGPEAWYIIEPEADVKFSSLQALQDQIALAISQVRDQYSRTTLGKTWTELSAEERALVSQKFPLRITLP